MYNLLPNPFSGKATDIYHGHKISAGTLKLCM
jgi:hypothetical protein